MIYECPVCRKRFDGLPPVQRIGEAWGCWGTPDAPHPRADLVMVRDAKSAPPADPARPAHYGGESNPFEPIKIIEAMGWGEAFCLGNAVKYLLRADKKGGTEDLVKAEWYIRRVIDNRTRQK